MKRILILSLSVFSLHTMEQSSAVQYGEVSQVKLHDTRGPSWVEVSQNGTHVTSYSHFGQPCDDRESTPHLLVHDVGDHGLTKVQGVAIDRFLNNTKFSPDGMILAAIALDNRRNYSDRNRNKNKAGVALCRKDKDGKFAFDGTWLHEDRRFMDIIEFTPDGKCLVLRHRKAKDEDKENLRELIAILDVQSGEIEHERDIGEGYASGPFHVNHDYKSPNYVFIAQGVLHMLDALTGETQRVSLENYADLEPVRYSNARPDNYVKALSVAAGMLALRNKNEIKIHDLKTGALLRKITSGQCGVYNWNNSVALLADGSTVIYNAEIGTRRFDYFEENNGSDLTYFVMRAAKGSAAAHLKSRNEFFMHAISADKKRLLVFTQAGAELFDTETDKRVELKIPKGFSPKEGAISADGTTVVLKDNAHFIIWKQTTNGASSSS